MLIYENKNLSFEKIIHFNNFMDESWKPIGKIDFNNALSNRLLNILPGENIESVLDELCNLIFDTTDDWEEALNFLKVSIILNAEKYTHFDNCKKYYQNNLFVRLTKIELNSAILNSESLYVSKRISASLRREEKVTNLLSNNAYEVAAKTYYEYFNNDQIEFAHSVYDSWSGNKIIGQFYKKLVIKKLRNLKSSIAKEIFELAKVTLVNELGKPPYDIDMIEEMDSKNGRLDYFDSYYSLAALNKVIKTNSLPQLCIDLDKLLSEIELSRKIVFNILDEFKNELQLLSGIPLKKSEYIFNDSLSTISVENTVYSFSKTYYKWIKKLHILTIQNPTTNTGFSVFDISGLSGRSFNEIYKNNESSRKFCQKYVIKSGNKYLIKKI